MQLALCLFYVMAPLILYWPKILVSYGWHSIDRWHSQVSRYLHPFRELAILYLSIYLSTYLRYLVDRHRGLVSPLLVLAGIDLPWEANIGQLSFWLRHRNPW